jgi:hypothetical protein
VSSRCAASRPARGAGTDHLAGTTAELIWPILEAGGLKAGRDIYLAFSPDREDPGNANFDLKLVIDLATFASARASAPHTSSRLEPA